MGYQVSRRQFLRLSALTFGAAATIEGLQALLASPGINSVVADSTLQTSTDDLIVPGVCLMCSGGCGTLARVARGHVVKLEGNPMHPVNLGTLCPKGQAAPELLYNPDRLSGPIQRVGERGSGNWQPIPWDEAAQFVAQKLNTLRSAEHPERAVITVSYTHLR